MSAENSMTSIASVLFIFDSMTAEPGQISPDYPPIHCRDRAQSPDADCAAHKNEDLQPCNSKQRHHYRSEEACHQVEDRSAQTPPDPNLRRAVSLLLHIKGDISGCSEEHNVHGGVDDIPRDNVAQTMEYVGNVQRCAVEETRRERVRRRSSPLAEKSDHQTEENPKGERKPCKASCLDSQTTQRKEMATLRRLDIFEDEKRSHCTVASDPDSRAWVRRYGVRALLPTRLFSNAYS